MSDDNGNNNEKPVEVDDESRNKEPKTEDCIKDKENDDDDDDEDNNNNNNNNNSHRMRHRAASFTSASSESFRRLSSSVSKEFVRRRSSLIEALPETPAGWATLVTTASSIVLAHELRLQQSLTVPPLVFGQQSERNNRLRKLLSGGDSDYDHLVSDIFTRNIKPSLFVGTRGVLSSFMAYAGFGPSQNTRLNFREYITMPNDGATVAIDWELPDSDDNQHQHQHQQTKSDYDRKQEILMGPIQKPVVLIKPGMNNDTNFGYLRSLMRACTDRGWIAAGINYRGAGGAPLTTPRGYSAAYTGDLRCIVWKISSRMAAAAAQTTTTATQNKDVSKSSTTPLFIVGNSLGANIVAKYLGEECRAGTLPSCVAGAVTLGNPLCLHGNNLGFPWAEALALGVKKYLLENLPSVWPTLRLDSYYRRGLLGVLSARTIAQVDEALAPFFIRNDIEPPFAFKIGYQNGEHYWDEASSYHYVPHITIPMLKIIAQDDFMVFSSSLAKLSTCLENPNITVVKTKCGGHLGWQESPPDTGNVFGFGTSWADTATMDFIEAAIQLRKEVEVEKEKNLHHHHKKNGKMTQEMERNEPNIEIPPFDMNQTTDVPLLRSKL